MSDPLTWSPISLGRWLGTTVRIHFLLIAFVAYELLRGIIFDRADEGLRPTACWLGLLVAALALHEAGHALTAWWFDSDQDVVRIWPLGNLVGPVYTPRPGQQLIVSAAGPVTSGALFLGSALALHFGWGAHPVWNPLGNEVDPGAAVLADGGLATPLSLVWFVGWFGYLNYVLLLVNLIPALPFDGGRMFRAYLAGTSIDAGRDQLYAPTTARACAIVLGLAGLVRLFRLGGDDGRRNDGADQAADGDGLAVQRATFDFDLGGGCLPFLEPGLVLAKERPLPDGRCSLQLVYGPRSGFETEQADSPCDRTRGDHNQRLTRPPQVGSLCADRVQHPLTKAAIVRGDDRGTKFHHQSQRRTSLECPRESCSKPVGEIVRVRVCPAVSDRTTSAEADRFRPAGPGLFL